MEKLVDLKFKKLSVYFHPLNFIRFILAVGVILFHYGVNYYPFNQGALHTLIVNSSFRVSFFFFISGFVMSMVYAKQVPDVSAVYFYKRRFTRIYPVYFLAFFWTILVVVFLKNASPKGLIVILHGLGLQSLYPGYLLDLNFTTWSISVELVFYLLFPFLLNWMMRFPLKKLVGVTLVIWLLQSLQHILFINYVYNGTKAMEEFISAFPLWHLSTFFAGMVTARFIALEAFGERFKNNALLIFSLSLLVLMVIVFVPNPVLRYVHNGLLSPVFLIIITSLYYDKSFVNRALSHRYLSRLGDLSYGLFIFQYPLWVSMTWLIKPELVQSNWFFLIYFVVLLLVARLVNVYFEKPLLKRLRGEK